MKKSFLNLPLFIISILLFASCNKNDDSSQNENPNYSSVGSYDSHTSIAGRVLNENNTAMAGVLVTANGHTVLSDLNGIFLFKNIGVNKDRCIVRFSKPGYFLRTQAFKPTVNSVNYLKIVLVSNTQVQMLSSSTGGTISLSDQSSVQFPPDAFVTSNGTMYTGMVNIVLKHLSPGASNFGFSIPGGDLLGINATGNDVVLYSYGMLGVTLTGSGGEALQLGNGINATINMPIASAQLGTAQASIPLWYFDETTALWKQQGNANKIGNKYVGTVSHFTWWNCDYQGYRANIEGKVINCSGVGLPNVVVTIDGWYATITDQNGEYFDWVPAGYAYTVQVLASSNPGLYDSQLENTPTLSNGQTFKVPDLILICPAAVTGDLVSCNGDNEEGLVFVKDDDDFFNFQYSINGNYKIGVVANEQLFVSAVSLNGSGQVIVPPISSNVTANVGPIVLCQTSPLYDNGFVLNGNGFHDRVFIMDTTYTLQLTNADTISYVVFGNDHLTGFSCFLEIIMRQTGIGFYDYSRYTNSLNIDVDGSLGGLVQYQSYFLPSAGTIEITRFDNIGGRVMASFSGTLSDINGAIIYVTNGRLNVPRRP